MRQFRGAAYQRSIFGLSGCKAQASGERHWWIFAISCLHSSCYLYTQMIPTIWVFPWVVKFPYNKLVLMGCFTFCTDLDPAVLSDTFWAPSLDGFGYDEVFYCSKHVEANFKVLSWQWLGRVWPHQTKQHISWGISSFALSLQTICHMESWQRGKDRCLETL